MNRLIHEKKGTIVTLILVFVIISLSQTQQVAAASVEPPSGLISWWSGDGYACDIIDDNHGTLWYDTTFAPGKVGDAFSFDGVNDQVTASGKNIDELQQLTIELWVKLDSMPNKIERFVSLAGEKAVLRHDGVTQQGQLHFYMRFVGFEHFMHIRVDGKLQVETFHHVAGTYDGHFMRLYLDGEEIGFLPIEGTVYPGNGVIFSSNGETIHGLLDEISIYNRALTPLEIKEIYDAGSSGKVKPPPPEFDYFTYGRYAPGMDSITGVGGYVEDYGDLDVWGDEVQYLYFMSKGPEGNEYNTGYKVRVWLTDYEDEHPGQDSRSPGWIDPNQHPLNPYATGPMEPRHFEIVSYADLTGYTGGSSLHTEEFHVDTRGIFLGAWPYGIHRWDHNWNNPEHIAFSTPERTESLAYNPDENAWYAGSRDFGLPYRDVYQLVDTNDDGSFLDEEWSVIFSYPSLGSDPSEHHDGLDYAGGYIWISDMFSDRIAQWYYHEGEWIEKNIFTYAEVAHVEGMGFGPNNHLWMSSGWFSQPSHIYEIGGGELQGNFPQHVYIDVKPGSWPNTLNIKSNGVLSVAICGTEDFDVTTIDPETVRIAGVAPLHWSVEDTATPYTGEAGDGHALDGDGYLDLIVHFEIQEIVDPLGLKTQIGETVPLLINGKLKEAAGGTQIQGQDYIRILFFLEEDFAYTKGHYYSAPFPDYNTPHVIKVGTWLTLGFHQLGQGETPEEAEATLRDHVASLIMEITFDGLPLVDPKSGYLWEYMWIEYDDSLGLYEAIVPYRYYLQPQPEGQYEICLKAWDLVFTGYVTWVEGQDL